MPQEPSTVAHVPLYVLLPTEWVCGVASASLMAPFIAVIDTSISANAGGVKSLKEGLVGGFKMLFTQPRQFLKWRPFQ